MMMSGPDYILDLTGPARSNDHPSAPSDPSLDAAKRPWLAVMWKCCSTYSRIYRNRSLTAYEGRCPRCGRSVRVGIGPSGSRQRFFEAG